MWAIRTIGCLRIYHEKTAEDKNKQNKYTDEGNSKLSTNEKNKENKKVVILANGKTAHCTLALIGATEKLLYTTNFLLDTDAQSHLVARKSFPASQIKEIRNEQNPNV